MSEVAGANFVSKSLAIIAPRTMTLKWGQRENDEAATMAPAHWHRCRRQWANWGDVSIASVLLAPPLHPPSSALYPSTLLSLPFRLLLSSIFTRLMLIFCYACDVQSYKFNSLTQLLLSIQPSLGKFFFPSHKFWRQSSSLNYSSYFIAVLFLEILPLFTNDCITFLSFSSSTWILFL